MTLQSFISSVRKRLDKSTPVVSWYAHPYEGQIRGPYNRWFKLDGPAEEIVQNSRVVRASAEYDIEMFAHAPQDLKTALQVIELLQDGLKEYAQIKDPGRGTKYWAIEILKQADEIVGRWV